MRALTFRNVTVADAERLLEKYRADRHSLTQLIRDGRRQPHQPEIS